MKFVDALTQEQRKKHLNAVGQRSENVTGTTNSTGCCTTQAEAAVNKVRGEAEFFSDMRVSSTPYVSPDPYARIFGIGGAPTRCSILPSTPADRKKYPIASGFMDYFPDAIAAISNLSWVGNEQHNPGQPLHWARGKSADEADTMLRHFLQRGTVDTDGVLHSVKMAWRALALLQKELEQPK